jgi:ferredoxin
VLNRNSLTTPGRALYTALCLHVSPHRQVKFARRLSAIVNSSSTFRRLCPPPRHPEERSTNQLFCSASSEPAEINERNSVEFVRTGRTITCGADENILDAAWTAGLTPPSSCTQGMCGTCKTTVLSGEVDTQHNGGIRPGEIARTRSSSAAPNHRATYALTADSGSISSWRHR